MVGYTTDENGVPLRAYRPPRVAEGMNPSWNWASATSESSGREHEHDAPHDPRTSESYPRYIDDNPTSYSGTTYASPFATTAPSTRATLASRRGSFDPVAPHLPQLRHLRGDADDAYPQAESSTTAAERRRSSGRWSVHTVRSSQDEPPAGSRSESVPEARQPQDRHIARRIFDRGRTAILGPPLSAAEKEEKERKKEKEKQRKRDERYAKRGLWARDPSMDPKSYLGM
ncbi:hypothetical protein JCM10450v2_000910 [Rhodotorula kratochvilovae]